MISCRQGCFGFVLNFILCYSDLFRISGAFPIFCKRSWSWSKTTLTGFETLSGLTLLYVLLKQAEVTKNRECTPYFVFFISCLFGSWLCHLRNFNIFGVYNGRNIRQINDYRIYFICGNPGRFYYHVRSVWQKK
ncbi:hypothetical protein KsCSTR_19060 [Candidatus Kuenenia stuttgartiensis]|uniref:Uncharacterized protein n=1 Tax=Kuenenia stuttgartiensis TaxID=174633 RepID=Q1Q2G0_KUEST|nr:hypothetical protein KsCSTR_19060 [Candidatus Kuenenia stuttgartiensis]CAJ74189.1 unknown protein [Candidatus Kuenenia stuttgartiensis]